MSDNPKKKKLDGKRVSEQPWEQAYQRRKNGRKKKEAVPSLKVYNKIRLTIQVKNIWPAHLTSAQELPSRISEDCIQRF